MKSQLIFLKLAWLLTISFFGGGVNAALPVPVPERICSGNNDNAPVFLHRSKDGVLQNFEVFITASGSYRGQYSTLSADTVAQICAKGISLSVLPVIAVPPVGADGLKVDTVPQNLYLPSSFQIQGITTIGYNAVIGNFWVAGIIPTEHNAHITQFTMEQTGFEVDYQNNKHLAVMTMHHTTDNFASAYRGKGMALGLCSVCFPSDTTLVYASISETWLVNNGDTQCQPGPCDVRVWFGDPYVNPPIPTTGVHLSPYVKYDFLVGANKSQQSVYYVRNNGDTNWGVTPMVDSYNASFNVAPWNLSQAGIAFLVAGTPDLPVGNWTLSFSGVSARTQP